MRSEDTNFRSKTWIDRTIDNLCTESIIRRVLRPFRRVVPWFGDPDHVSMLRHFPIGMFFYNLRAIILVASGLVLVGSVTAGWRTPQAPGMAETIALLVGVWLAGVATTAILHRSFRRMLDDWASEIDSPTFPAAFHRYFVLDTVLIVLLFGIGRTVQPPYAVSAVCWLLLANIVVYTGYDLAAMRRRYGAVLLLPLVIGGVLLWDASRSAPPAWLLLPLEIAPVIATCFVSVFAVYTITRARRVDAVRVDEYIDILGRVGVLLAPPDFDAATVMQRTADYRDYREREFRERLIESMRLVCSREHFWFRAGCIWLVEPHRDRGDVLLSVAFVDFPEGRSVRDGVNASSGFLASTAPIVVRSLSRAAAAPEEARRWRFRVADDVPAALVPIEHGERRIGVLVVYGGESGVVTAADRTFLTALTSIVANALEQWETFLRAVVLDELDALFGCDSLDVVLMQADTLLKRYLAARGCMIVFRPDPAAARMEVRAIDGFRPSILGATYDVGTGLTGLCAASGVAIRVDDVRLHQQEFDHGLLRRVERAHGHPIESWLALPIGPPHRNYGVIKVVNSTYPAKWFTAFDQRLGTDVAMRLHVTIEKILHVERTVEATKTAQESAAAARSAQKGAEETAQRRQQDIMTVMHQLQAPLLAIINALTGIDSHGLSVFNADLIEYATALVEDAIALGFGTVSVFAKESGRSTMFQEAEIDASSELEGLTKRLRRTQKREDLSFRFQHDPEFPRLSMDPAVFASVFYSLIHNAMKYADHGSEVVLESGFEGSAGQAPRPALKVKTTGEPIDWAERELVFGKFVRGHSVERGKIYKGVGLGLWVARGLMEMLGGALTLELDRENPRRAIFVVHVPGAERYERG
ncbi:MAG TPA: GAF domain-containing protein [Thermoanaerobaculia bacterium]|jgi:signal transduction histidine kinase